MDAFVGWVPGGKVEVIIQDEKLGPVFYTLDPPVGDHPPRVVRATDSCLQCHATSRISGVPGSELDGVVFPAEVSRRDDLAGLIDTEKYLKPTSDVVALMVLEHQCRVHNLLTKGRMGYLRARYFQESFGEEAELDAEDGMSWKTAESSAMEIVDAFLFRKEAVLGRDGIEGGKRFAEAFGAGGVLTSRGKSLGDFRL